MSSSSDDSAPNEEDAKMQQLLAEWDDDDSDNKEDLYVDSDDDEDDGAAAKKKALLKKKAAKADSESEEEESEESSGEEESEEDSSGEEEEVVEEEEVSDSDDAPKKKSKDDSESEEHGVVEANDDDDDDEIVVKKKPKKQKEKVKVKKLTEVDPDDDPEAAKMKALLAGWGGDDDDDDDSDDDSEDGSESDPSERELELEDNLLDHIILAAPDLDEAMKDFESMAGTTPVIAGAIKGLGIKCARVSFAGESYLEIIAPDPDAPGPIGQLLKNKSITELTPFHYAIRSSKAEQLKDTVKEFGYTPDHISMFGAKKDGTPKKWEMLFLYKHKMGGIAPYIINWDNSEHPCATLPIVGKLKKFTVRFPEGDPAHKLLKHLNPEGVNVETGKPKMSFQFSSPEGTVKFATSKAVGYKFPGFEDSDEEEEDDDAEFEAPKAPELLDVPDDY